MPPSRIRLLTLGLTACGLLSLTVTTRLWSLPELHKRAPEAGSLTVLPLVFDDSALLDSAPLRVVGEDELQEPPAALAATPKTKYLSYLAHSGFSNQRIALVNALVLSQLLNRTLLVPPVQLGTGVYWHPHLQQKLEVADKVKPSSCSKVKGRVERKIKCGAAWDSVRVRWSDIVDMESISAIQPVTDRQRYSRMWLKRHLSISEADVHRVPDESRLSYQFHDLPLPATSSSSSRFEKRLLIDDLANIDAPLLELGSLFAHDRLDLQASKNVQLMERIDRMTALSHPQLRAASEEIVASLGGRESLVVGVHLRRGKPAEGPMFLNNAATNMRAVFVSVAAKLLGKGKYRARLLLFGHDNDSHLLHRVSPPSSVEEQHFLSSTMRCRGQLHDPNGPLAPLNAPMFIATDSSAPEEDEELRLFRDTFPCLFFLRDWQRPNELNGQKALPQVEEVLRMRDAEGEHLGKFMLPFLDGLIAGSAQSVIGTPKSTFSRYIASVLFPALHDNIDV